MEVTFGVDAVYFLWSLGVGGLLAFVYDVLRATRRMTTVKDLVVTLEDFFYALFTGVILFLTAYGKNEGELRWHGILGTVSGFFLYKLLFRNIVVNLLVKTYDLLVLVVVHALKIVLFPLRMLYKLLKKPFVVVGWYSKQGAGRAARRIKVQGGRLKNRIKSAEIAGKKK